MIIEPGDAVRLMSFPPHGGAWSEALKPYCRIIGVVRSISREFNSALVEFPNGSSLVGVSLDGLHLISKGEHCSVSYRTVRRHSGSLFITLPATWVQTVGIKCGDVVEARENPSMLKVRKV